MNKLISKIVGAFLGVTMATGIGVGVAVGTRDRDVAPASAAATDGTECVLWNSSNGYQAIDSFTTSTDGAIKWKLSAGNTYSKPTRIYANNTFTIQIADATKASSINGVVIAANDSSQSGSTSNTASATWTATGTSASVTASGSSGTVTATTSGTVTLITIKPSKQVRWDSLTVYYQAAGGGGSSYTDTYSLDGQERLIKANTANVYIPSSIATTGRAGQASDQSSAAKFAFTLVGDNQFRITLQNGTHSGKYLVSNNDSNTGNSSAVKVNADPMTWTVETDASNNIHLKDPAGHYLAAYSTTEWRMYANTNSGYPNILFETYVEKIVTVLSVSPSSWSGYDSQTISVSSYTVSVTTNGSAGTSDDYEFQGIGTGTGDNFVARDASFSNGHPTTADTRLQWKAKYPNTSGGSTYLYTGVDLTVSADSVSSIAVTGNLTTTSYGLNSSWSAAGLTVNAYYASAPSTPVDVTSQATWTWSPATPNSTSITSVTATASFGGQTASSTAQSVTVTVQTSCTYDFVTNFGTYANSWGTGYTTHTVTSNDLDANIAGSFAFTSTNKSTSTITDRPVLKKSDNAKITYTLDSSLSSDYSVASVTVTFIRWGTDSGNLSLYKGTSTSADALATVSIATTTTLSVANVNDSQFTILNGQGRIGLTSIAITLEAASPFGTLDHITVMSLPTQIHYDSGDNYASAGLSVFAFDGENESTAISKDVTNSVTSSLSDGALLGDSHVPYVDVELEYTEGTITVDTSFRIYVYAYQEYSLVQEEPTDWSGSYIIVGTLGDNSVALDSSLSEIDVTPNYKVIVTSDGEALAGQWAQVTIESMTGGNYSIKASSGKFIGWNSVNDNGIHYYNQPQPNAISLSDDNAVIKGNGGDNGNGTCRQLCFNTIAGQERFRYLQSGGAIQLYKLVESSEANTFASTFLSTLSTDSGHVCDAQGNTDVEDLQAAWELLAEAFDGLDVDDKEIFRTGLANENGSDVEKALALYDYIAVKYNTQLQSQTLTNYNFMNRSSAAASNNRINIVDLNNNAVVIIASIFAVLSFTTIGGYFLLRKKKEER